MQKFTRIHATTGLLGFLVLATVPCSSAWALEPQTLAASCAGCHGPVGISPVPLWPNLANQGKDYLVKQLKAFRSGERLDPMMSPMAAPLSDATIEALAEYYSTIKPAALVEPTPSPK